METELIDKLDILINENKGSFSVLYLRRKALNAAAGDTFILKQNFPKLFMTKFFF
jgi:hypothetical protein